MDLSGTEVTEPKIDLLRTVVCSPDVLVITPNALTHQNHRPDQKLPGSVRSCVSLWVEAASIASKSQTADRKLAGFNFG